MSTLTKLSLIALLAGSGAVYQSVSNAHEAPAHDTCFIDVQSASGATTLTGIARGNTGETGQYRLLVKGGSGRNTTSTSQGGAFSIGSDGEARTGLVRLSSGGIYDAELQVRIGGTTHSCSQRIGDRI